MSSKLLGFAFNLNLPKQAILTPEKQNVINNFDYMGDMLSLQRIDGENTVDYRDRLWDVTVHPAGPTYVGVINGLARDLGITRELAMTIDLKLNSAGEAIASNPRVNILSNKVVFYSDWRPDGTAVIDKEIQFYKQSDSGHLLSELVALLNDSIYFSCVIDPSVRPNIPSTNILEDTSDLIVQSELVEGHNITHFTFERFIEDSVTLSEQEIFKTEVLIEPAADGEYQIDYESGSVKAFLLPSGRGTIGYHSAQFPMKVDYLPVEIYTFQDENYQKELFIQKELDSGEETNYLLNTEGSETYHQLYLASKIFWGN